METSLVPSASDGPENGPPLDRPVQLSVHVDGNAKPSECPEERTQRGVDALRRHGSTLRDSGRVSDAEPFYERSLTLAREIGYDAGIAHALNCLATIAQLHGDLTTASTRYREALEIAERCGEHRLVGMIEQNLGVLADTRGNRGEALAHYRLALHGFEEACDVQQVSWVLNNLGILLTRDEQFDEARSTFDRALALVRERGESHFEGVVEENRGALELQAGNVREALPSIERAVGVAERRKDLPRLAAALKLLGVYRRLTGDLPSAEAALRRAAVLNPVGEDALLDGEIALEIGRTLEADGRGDAARAAWTEALATFERIGAREWASLAKQRLEVPCAGCCSPEP